MAAPKMRARKPPAVPAPLGAARLQQALEGLPNAQRVVLRLRFIERRSTAETARALGTTEQEIKRCQAAALVALRVELGEG